MKEPRTPSAFSVDPDKNSRHRRAPREPAAIRNPESATLILSEIDAFEEEAVGRRQPAAVRRRGGPGWGSLFLASAGALLALALGLWVEGLVRELFSRADWLGWSASAFAIMAALALLALFIREILALFRLRSVTKLQQAAAEAAAINDRRKAMAAIASVVQLVSANPSTAGGRKVLAELEGDVIDGADLIRIAERELFTNLDREARRIVLESAKRVSVVTAVSPRALIDVVFVIFESGRLIRRLSQHYGARPGMLGFVRLVRRVIGHLAVTGSIAIGDGLAQQLIGHGVAARLSARLGEGVINGLMTVRIGIAAIETVRPLPFVTMRRPSMSDFLPGLTGSSGVAGRNKV